MSKLYNNPVTRIRVGWKPASPEATPASLVVTIPKHLLVELGWQAGDMVKWTVGKSKKTASLKRI